MIAQIKLVELELQSHSLAAELSIDVVKLVELSRVGGIIAGMMRIEEYSAQRWCCCLVLILKLD